MATLSVTHTFSNGTTADALQVNQNFNDVKSFVESSVVHADGAVKAGVSALDFALTGIIVPYVGTTAPTGWLLCRGQLVSKATYAALYAVVGANAFGTDTGTDFYLPNLQGRVPVGVSTTDTDFDRADVGGDKTVTLSAAQSGLPSHGHGITDPGHDHGSLVGSSGSMHTHALPGVKTKSDAAMYHNGSTTLAAGGSNASGEISLVAGTAGSDHTHGSTVYSNTTGVSVNSNSAVNASEAHTNLQPYIALNYIVKT